MTNWIPTTERLPDDGVVALIVATAYKRRERKGEWMMMARPRIRMAEYDGADGWNSFDFLYQASHWQPLPALPESEG